MSRYTAWARTIPRATRRSPRASIDGGRSRCRCADPRRRRRRFRERPEIRLIRLPANEDDDPDLGRDRSTGEGVRGPGTNHPSRRHRAGCPPRSPRSEVSRTVPASRRERRGQRTPVGVRGLRPGTDPGRRLTGPGTLRVGLHAAAGFVPVWLKRIRRSSSLGGSVRRHSLPTSTPRRAAGRAFIASCQRTTFG